MKFTKDFEHPIGRYLLDGSDEEEGASLYSYLLLPSRPLTEFEQKQLIQFWKTIRTSTSNQISVQFYFPIENRDLAHIEKMETSDQWSMILGLFHKKRSAVIVSRLNTVELEQPVIAIAFKSLGQLAKDRSYSGETILLVDCSKLMMGKAEEFYHLFLKELIYKSGAIIQNQSYVRFVKSLEPYFDAPTEKAIQIITLTD